MTDIELSKKIHCTIYEEYRKALDIITINPDYSLVIFRNILSHLCQQIATYNYIELNETSLDKKIKKRYYVALAQEKISKFY